ncbi:PREDICTED: T-cell-interacting, activating receptor on myeloid cells protein 1-like isoform X2 [Myotis brandtii]|uniref:T-cell-interacting, activating receptor on myeloid cells protein 1-like isoform X1 n=1 Tax=Myotis brandtii TaxID=109478 RepID=UPI000703ECEB|nr:PREDICTED: T-cell-interacting, activating receptor on myeloid cells protein 1-like isoform X1 [Myotis brandtii]XP_014383593.1 PREDICTED: T-cell-interacting, activating receptor on myeloid cells protein 1-like isoform X2 [Myotis brandtii]
MTLPFLALFCVGLCAGQNLRRDGSLPRPSIRARPSWVVPANSTVTLQCSIPIREVIFRDIKFAFRKNNVSLESLPSSDSPEGLAEFHLSDIKLGDAGKYTCDYRTGSPTRRSLLSDVLLLLVTGELLKPSLHARPGCKVTAGENVILQCQLPKNVIEPHMFALLKKGTSTPIKLQGPVKTETDFSLPSVTVNDTGAYSCVYYVESAPFYASEPSDELTISVTGTQGMDTTTVDDEATKSATSTELATLECGSSHTPLLTDETESPKRAGAALGTTEIILIVIVPLLFLLTAFLICKYTCCGAALKKMTKSSHSSKKAEEVVTDASPATQSCSPALDEGSQVSRAEEPQGVTYAELNTRALSKGPSSQVPQSPETCVYSALKM